MVKEHTAELSEPPLYLGRKNNDKLISDKLGFKLQDHTKGSWFGVV